ncbi:MAG TPA: iron-containing alcohol dehydrogenase [Vicinamibacterales bacterium]|jgi:alcohol dehydrogenase
MIPFDFHARTRVIFGPGVVDSLGRLARDLGFRRTLLVADAGVVQAGYVERALQNLAAAEIQTFPFHDFGQNPDSAMVEGGRAFAAPLRIDSIVGFGGGSSLDCAKGINFLLTNGGTIADFKGYGKAARQLLPMIGVPTTAGTGSEAQSYAVISDASTHMKMACGDPSAAMKIAILDPELTLTAPAMVTAMSGYDAIAHAVETWVTTKRTPLSDTFSGRAWEMLGGAFERVLSDPSDLSARSAMLLGSHFAGMAIELSMLGAAHACSNPLTARFDIPHGHALSIVLPHVVRWNAVIVKERYGALLDRSSSDGAGELAAKLESFAATAGLGGRLRDRGVTSDALPTLAALAAEQWTGTFNPRPFDASGALEIYRAAF